MGKKTKIPKNLDIEEYVEVQTRIQKAREEKAKMDMQKQKEAEEIELQEEQEKVESSREKFAEEIKYEPEKSELENRTFSKKTESYIKIEDAKTNEEKKRIELLKTINKLEEKKKQEEER